MAKAFSKSFYASKKWHDLRFSLLTERGPVCQNCKGLINKQIDCKIHHLVELTEDNVHDPSIALNPDKLLVLCPTCHDRVHHRFGRVERGVYITYGPPLAGKTTFVKQNMGRGDLVVCMDNLYQAVSLMDNYDKPDNLLANVLAVRNTLLDNIRTRHGKWYSCWIIGGYPERYAREQLAKDLGAELIYIEATKEECLERLSADDARKDRYKEYEQYIDSWFNKYTE